MKKYFILIPFLYIGVIKAQVGFQWVMQLGGFGSDVGSAVTVDSSGNVYSTGHFFGIADFDPGPGVASFTAAGNEDIYISKLDAAGNFVWAKQIGGGYPDYGQSIAVDTNGNVYTAGFFTGTVDFDPGIGVFNISSFSGNSDVFISKLDAAGNFIFAKRLGGPGYDYGLSLALDANSNIYTTGYFSGVADFDPGSGFYNISCTGFYDIFVSKLDLDGNFVWAKQLSGTNDEQGKSVAVDASGNVYTTGYFMGTADFDPGSGVYNLTSVGMKDIFVSKLNSSGNFVWAKQMGGAADNYGNSITVDAGGNVYTLGNFSVSADFDPGAGVYNLTSVGWEDIFISKLDANGTFIWAKQIGGPFEDYGNGILVDVSSNIYTVGQFLGPTDFDPGFGVYNLTSPGGGDDIYINKLDQNGSFVWAVQMGGTSIDGGFGIALDSGGSIYTTGYFGTSPADFYPGPGILNLYTFGASDIFVEKICQNTNQPLTIFGNTVICSGTSNVYSITPIIGALSYNWSLPGGWTGTSFTNTISTFASVTGGNITVSELNTCAASTMQSLSITVNPSPTISVNSGNICLGNSFTITPSGASTYTFEGSNAIVTPTSNSTYTVTGSSIAGCVSSAFVVANVTVNPYPLITASSGTICSGNSFSISVTGASTYTYQGGNSVVSPTASTSYSVIGTSAQGCLSTNTAISNITVDPTATLTASSNASVICIGQSATLTANSSSANYLWNTNATTATIAITPTVTTNYIVSTYFGSCTSSIVVTQSVDICTTINEISNEKNNIYPNPAIDVLTIELKNENSFVQVINSLGEIIFNKKASSKFVELKFTDLPKGIYFVRINSETKKIIKE